MADVLAFAFFIVLAFFLLARWLSWYWRLRILHYPLIVDVTVSIAVLAIYGGTLTGVMAASTAAVIISLLLARSRKMFGHIYVVDGRRKYVPGRINLIDKILEDLRDE